MRVAFNARYLYDYSLRGFNRYTFCLLKALQQHPEIDLYLFTDQRREVHPKFRSALKGAVVRVASPRALLWEQWAVPLALRKRKVEIFHAPADAGLPAVRACKYVLTYHDAADRGLEAMIRSGYLAGRVSDFLDGPDRATWHGKYVKARADLFRWLHLRSADVIITVSEFSKTELVHLLGVPERKIRVTHLAADEAFFEPIPPPVVERVRGKYGLPPAYILFVSSFDRRKNVLGLLQAYAQFRQAGEKEPLVLIGTGGDLGAVLRAADSLGLSSGREVFFLGGIGEDLPALYRGATLFVTLAWKETFCFPAVEAMACGLPVVASNTGAIPEIVGDGGILIDPRDHGGIVRALRDVLHDEGRQVALGEKAAARARQFSWKTVADRTLAIYRELLSQA